MNVIDGYLTAKKNLLSHFNCRQDYPIKDATGYYWEITGDGEVSILSYHESPDKKYQAVIVRGESGPLVYVARDYTLAVAIDCVRTAFLLRNCFNVKS